MFKKLFNSIFIKNFFKYSKSKLNYKNIIAFSFGFSATAIIFKKYCEN